MTVRQVIRQMLQLTDIDDDAFRIEVVIFPRMGIRIENDDVLAESGEDLEQGVLGTQTVTVGRFVGREQIHIVPGEE